MTDSLLHFPRPELAHELALSVAGERLFDSGASGLFLSAPRRTGKSTFLRQDLVPALENAGATCVYVDLWERRDADPGLLIAAAVAKATKKAQSVVSRLSGKLAAGEIDVNGWISLRAEKIGETDGPTFFEALEALAGLARGPVALIIDEAQQALVSDAGEQAMFSLKAARDAMNSPNRTMLRLVMTGSDRDKLLRLVISAAAPFYGAEVRSMPTLDNDYIRFVAARIEREHPDSTPVDVDLLSQAFESFAFQPEPFGAAIGAALNPLRVAELPLEMRILEASRIRQESEYLRLDSEFAALPPLARLVLWQLLERRERFKPFDRDAQAFYSRAMAVLGEARTLDAQKIQRALKRLRESSPPLVWRSAKGEYALEDTAMQRWFELRLREGHWPPMPEKGAGS